jgi:hypothetical protein
MLHRLMCWQHLPGWHWLSGDRCCSKMQFATSSTSMGLGSVLYSNYSRTLRSTTNNCKGAALHLLVAPTGSPIPPGTLRVMESQAHMHLCEDMWLAVEGGVGSGLSCEAQGYCQNCGPTPTTQGYWRQRAGEGGQPNHTAAALAVDLITA